MRRPEGSDMIDDRQKRGGDSAACEEHREELLDEALEESFPASDPPSPARPPAKKC
jgi:hypothetical protein